MYATWKASDKRWAFSLNSSEGAQFIDDDVYAELFAAQSEGRIISVGANGMPITIAPPEVPLCVQRNNALTQLSSWEISERAAGIEHARHHWLTTPEALQDIRDALLAGVVPGGIWVDAERNRVPMALTELQALWTACVERGAAIYQRRLELEAQISQLDREQLEQFSPSW
ncbi:hypothetical protein GCM10007860_09240 [Chitiniphilus shinanonensis]|uniref:DUF4376 domain-containing protein n=1 Tax=Chitiniphilus shinanonensis TaxID=553088 RepID=A0ABQ6BQ52_9NEIS|nr:DUF4376 domain-containing protein [Chitiniphilus shinanonensis]GLS03779.1 hypothetical protein GCM10007860_09240 [Chitiniphilus shinanonensis]